MDIFFNKYKTSNIDYNIILWVRYQTHAVLFGIIMVDDIRNLRFIVISRCWSGFEEDCIFNTIIFLFKQNIIKKKN